MSGPYKCTVDRNYWALVRNTTMNTYLEKYPVTFPDMNSVFNPFYL